MNDEAERSTETRLRESLAQVLGVSVEAVPGESRLADLFPEARRIEAWRQWQQACPLPLPALDHPLSTKMGWFAGGFLGALFLLAFLRTLGVHIPSSMLVGGIVGLLAGAVGLRWVAAPGLSFPPGLETLADLAARLDAGVG
ncbi:MAG: hypothetical protein IPJ98_09645 [Bryobacterales bacterium]|nr:hypothetical protein [Bryobacterales bacterium]